MSEVIQFVCVNILLLQVQNNFNFNFNFDFNNDNILQVVDWSYGVTRFQYQCQYQY